MADPGQTQKPVVYCFFDEQKYSRSSSASIEEEIQLINSIFGPAHKDGHIQLIVKERATSKVFFSLDKNIAEEIKIFHFSGTEESYNTLCNDLSLTERSPNIRLFFYKDCPSEEIANQLTEKGVGIVITVPEGISDPNGLAFIEHFYGNLAHNQTISSAFQTARSHINNLIQEQDSRNISNDYSEYQDS